MAAPITHDQHIYKIQSSPMHEAKGDKEKGKFTPVVFFR